MKNKFLAMLLATAMILLSASCFTSCEGEKQTGDVMEDISGEGNAAEDTPSADQGDNYPSDDTVKEEEQEENQVTIEPDPYI